MRIAILSTPPDASAYIGEILNAWGVFCHTLLEERNLPTLVPAAYPVLICRRGPLADKTAAALIDYATRGGTLILMEPRGPLASAAGLEWKDELNGHVRLRMTSLTPPGLAGERLPIAAPAAHYDVTAADVEPLACLLRQGVFRDHPGITRRRAGQGWIIACAFDLPRSVQILRQGDPANAERLPEGDPCARPAHLVGDTGPHECGWIPYADLLGGVLAELVRLHVPAPMPVIATTPRGAPGIVLYSGDEDIADVAWNDAQMEEVSRANGRLNLYIIPTATKSTPGDVQRYRARHDVGPHPDLRRLDGRPVAERMREYDRQFKMFRDMFNLQPLSVRNHCTAWAGYMEPIEVMQRNGIQIEGNYFSGGYKRDRDPSPYGSFGGALPLRFAAPDGQLYRVFQQHTHLADDLHFGTADYSLRISPDHYDPMLERILSDIATRTHTPYAVCIHPSNWVRFSGPQGRILLRLAQQHAMPVWSFDQWLAFWRARDGWRGEGLSWSDGRLTCRLQGLEAHDGLMLLLPWSFGGLHIVEACMNGRRIAPTPLTRHGRRCAALPVDGGMREIELTARYGANV